ncbi:alpha/beta fold hydrolase [Deinococcus radiopugnans]|nr:alpha/beta fold hydrolase [Deinococcus radiopugnans]MBB6018769.1 pimeloyl-ACP methyl ester carboxylesterase [Deinococcus radiopugnans ATCC 19172]
MRRLTVLPMLALSSVLLAACNSAAPPIVEPPKTTGFEVFETQKVVWGSCDATVLGFDASKFFEPIKGRLQCTDIQVPLDWAKPERGVAVMSMIRVSASVPAKRQGALFFNPGGPGGDGLVLAPLYGVVWDDADTKTKIGADLKRLSQEYDLIGFSPRGVGNSTRVNCGINELVPYIAPPASDRSEQNIQRMIQLGRLTAKACQNNPLTPFVNTDATARDLNLARQLLGEAKLNFVGYSYGTWLGSWYAKLFPQSTGRMLLDGNTDFASDTFEDTFKLQPRAFERDFRDVVAPYLGRLAPKLGLPAATGEQVYAAQRGLSEPLRTIVGFEIAQNLYGRDSYPNLALLLQSATVVDKLTKAKPEITLPELLNASQAAEYFSDPDLNEASKQVAINLIFARDTELQENPIPVVLNESNATFTAVLCNDTPWTTDLGYWRARDDEEAAKYPLIGGSSVSSPCLYWKGGPSVSKPKVPTTMPPLLLVQNEFDPATATEGALNAFNQTPNTKLIYLDDEPQHTAFPYGTECVDLPVTGYLLNGTLPTAKRTDCAAKPLPLEEKVYPVKLTSLGNGQYCWSQDGLNAQGLQSTAAQQAARAARELIAQTARENSGIRGYNILEKLNIQLCK